MRIQTRNNYALLGSLVSMLLVAQACRPNTVSSASDADSNSNIRMSLAHAHVLADEDFDLVFSSLDNVVDLGLCVIKTASDPCAKTTPGYAASKLIYANSKRNFFQMLNPALLSDGLMFRVVAFDRAGALSDQRVIELKWIGAGQPPAAGRTAGVGGASPAPSASPGFGGSVAGAAGQAGASTAFGSQAPAGTSSSGSANIVDVISRSCGGCHSHNQYVNNPNLMKSTNSAERIRSGNMPPPGSRNMSAADRQALLTFLGQ